MDLDWWDEKVSGLFVTIRIKLGGGGVWRRFQPSFSP